ncbi:MAG: AAA family ATPase, partial [Acidobacteriota bacterium]
MTPRVEFMLLEKLIAGSFGPFTNESLEFAEGFNIFYGPNEAGKSSWHAAIFAALCGFRRSQGRNKDYAEFKARHRPRPGSEWVVSLILKLEKGRHVELFQNLDNRTGTACDVDLGRQYANEIIRDHAPDATTWLGLSRDVFRAIACVRQAQVLEVLNDPASLQQYLQRAVDTLGGDATASEALAILEKFQKENVGTLRATTKPLYQATCALEEAEAQLERAQQRRGEYQSLAARATVAKSSLARISHKRRLWEAALAKEEAQQVGAQYERAAELSERHPEVPGNLSNDEEMLQAAAAAIDGWRNRPASLPPPTPSPQTLEQRLVALGAVGEGDLEPDSALEPLLQHFRRSRQRLEDHLSIRPREVSEPPSHGAITPAELRELGHLLSKPRPASDPSQEEKFDSLKARIEALKSLKKKNRSLLLGAGVLGIAGLVLLALQLTWPGIGSLIVGLVLGVGYFLRNPDSQIVELRFQLQSCEERMGDARVLSRSWQEEQEKARQRVEELGIEANSDELQRLADQVENYQRYVQQQEAWEAKRQDFAEEDHSASTALSEWLQAKGCDPAGDLESGVKRYRQECQIRSQRRQLQADLDSARKEQERAVEVEKRREAIEQRLRQVAEGCGLTFESPEQAVAELEALLERSRERTQAHERALKEYTELEGLLGGGSLEELEERRNTLNEHAATLVSRFSEKELKGVDLKEAAAHLEALRAQEKEEGKESVRLQTQLDAFERSFPSVAECGEKVTAAQEGVERLNKLGQILDLTQKFLRQAEEEMHRNIAPRLAEIIREWLPRITQGRYTDARLDPTTLLIKVQDRGGNWIDTTILSHGTSEQV